MKTFMAKADTVERKWYEVDATNLPLGRLASQIADILTGKNKTTYTPHVDMGDCVIVVNTDLIVLTGKKLEQKMMTSHSGYIGGLKQKDYKTVMREDSTKAVREAVKGMLPKNSMGRKQIVRLKLYKGAVHEHTAQKPEKISLKGVKN